MQRKDESTPTTAARATSSLAAKGSSTQSTVTVSETGSVPSTATGPTSAATKGSTTQTLLSGAKVPQDDPTTVHAFPGRSSASYRPGHIIKGTDGQGTTGQSNVAGVTNDQHYTQGNTFINCRFHDMAAEDMSHGKQTVPINNSGDQESVSEDTPRAEGKQWRQEGGQPPHLTSKREMEEGNMKLIHVDRNNMLSEACREGKLGIVKNIIATGSVDINTRSEGGWTPVLTAADIGYRGIFDVLVREGCNLSAVLDNGNNILHVACFGGNFDITKYLVSHRVVSLESKGMCGRTAVMEAANAGHKSVFDLLVSAGCNLSVVDDDGNNILHTASFGGNERIVDYLISHDIADIESRGQYGRTAVMLAAADGQTKVFDLLVSKGCNLSVVDADGNNILHAAWIRDSERIVDYLISHDIADIESRGWCWRTSVMLAAAAGQEKIFNLLVSKGCKLSVVDDNGDNILHVACLSESVQIVDYLISHDIADIESRGKWGRTPVMVAAADGQEKVFNLLVSKGCNLSVVDDEGSNIQNVACLGDNVQIVDYLISHDMADIESRGGWGRTPVMDAAADGQKNVFDLLVSRGCNLSVVDDKGDNILHAACLSDNVQIVDYLISHDIADIESRGRYGGTAVMKAATDGNKKVFDLLVSKGCNLSVVDDEGNNILHVACLSDNVQIVDYLISHHIADIESRGRWGRTAVMTAAVNGMKKVFDLLVSKGCKLSVVDDKGDNILHVACLRDNVQIVDYLISHDRADKESRGQYGRTAVMVAAVNGMKKVFDLLVSKGCKLSVVDDEGNNILHVACLSDNVQIVDYLISHDKADIESRGLYGETAVMKAATRGHQKVFDLLVGKGCNLSVVDDRGNNILHVACLSDNVQIVDYLISHDIADFESRGKWGRTAVMVAAAAGNKKVLDLLVSKGCNLSVVDDKGNNILHVACLSGNEQIVDYLISHDRADIESRGQYGRTAVMVAAVNGKEKVFNLLVSKGCNMSVVDDDGDNILHVACLSDNVQIVDYLISHDRADIESRGRWGRTALMVAAVNGKEKVFNLLVSKGCNMSVVDDDGDNILHVACVSDNVQIVDYLISHDMADIESRGGWGRTAVMVAAADGQKKNFDLLVSKGCNLSVVDDNGGNILHAACLSDNVQIVDYLISHDIADKESRGKYGRTAVMTAAANGKKKVWDLLVSQGCNLSEVDDEGNNISHLSCLGGSVDIVRQLLVVPSVDVSSTNIYGQTPVQVARDFQQDDVVRLLSSRGYT